MTELCNPEPDLLNDVLGLALRPVLSIKSSLAGPDVGVLGLDPAGALKDLPEAVKGEVDGDANVGGDEVRHCPVSASEHSKAVEEDDTEV